MGGIVCISADLSAFEKETIVNTKANKFRDMVVRKKSVDPSEQEQCSESESLESFQEASGDRVRTVEFFGTVRERIYFTQDEAASPVFQDLSHILMKQSDTSCDTGLHTWSTRTKAHIAGEGNRPLRSSR